MRQYAGNSPQKVGILCLIGLLLFAFLGMSLHVVLHHHHDEHGEHHHGEEHPAPHDCPYCVVLSALVFLVVALLRFVVPPGTAAQRPALRSHPRALHTLRAHPHRGPPLAHLF